MRQSTRVLTFVLLFVLLIIVALVCSQALGCGILLRAGSQAGLRAGLQANSTRSQAFGGGDELEDKLEDELEDIRKALNGPPIDCIAIEERLNRVKTKLLFGKQDEVADLSLLSLEKLYQTICEAQLETGVARLALAPTATAAATSIEISESEDSFADRALAASEHASKGVHEHASTEAHDTIAARLEDIENALLGEFDCKTLQHQLEEVDNEINDLLMQGGSLEYTNQLEKLRAHCQLLCDLTSLEAELATSSMDPHFNCNNFREQMHAISQRLPKDDVAVSLRLTMLQQRYQIRCKLELPDLEQTLSDKLSDIDKKLTAIESLLAVKPIDCDAVRWQLGKNSENIQKQLDGIGGAILHEKASSQLRAMRGRFDGLQIRFRGLCRSASNIFKPRTADLPSKPITTVSSNSKVLLSGPDPSGKPSSQYGLPLSIAKRILQPEEKLVIDSLSRQEPMAAATETDASYARLNARLKRLQNEIDTVTPALMNVSGLKSLIKTIKHEPERLSLSSPNKIQSGEKPDIDSLSRQELMAAKSQNIRRASFKSDPPSVAAVNNNSSRTARMVDNIKLTIAKISAQRELLGKTKSSSGNVSPKAASPKADTASPLLASSYDTVQPKAVTASPKTDAARPVVSELKEGGPQAQASTAAASIESPKTVTNLTSANVALSTKPRRSMAETRAYAEYLKSTIETKPNSAIVPMANTGLPVPDNVNNPSGVDTVPSKAAAEPALVIASPELATEVARRGTSLSNGIQPIPSSMAVTDTAATVSPKLSLDVIDVARALPSKKEILENLLLAIVNHPIEVTKGQRAEIANTWDTMSEEFKRNNMDLYEKYLLIRNVSIFKEALQKLIDQKNLTSETLGAEHESFNESFNLTNQDVTNNVSSWASNRADILVNQAKSNQPLHIVDQSSFGSVSPVEFSAPIRDGQSKAVAAANVVSESKENELQASNVPMTLTAEQASYFNQEYLQIIELLNNKYLADLTSVVSPEDARVELENRIKIFNYWLDLLKEKTITLVDHQFKQFVLEFLYTWHHNAVKQVQQTIANMTQAVPSSAAAVAAAVATPRHMPGNTPQVPPALGLPAVPLLVPLVPEVAPPPGPLVTSDSQDNTTKLANEFIAAVRSADDARLISLFNEFASNYDQAPIASNVSLMGRLFEAYLEAISNTGFQIAVLDEFGPLIAEFEARLQPHNDSWNQRDLERMLRELSCEIDRKYSSNIKLVFVLNAFLQRKAIDIIEQRDFQSDRGYTRPVISWKPTFASPESLKSCLKTRPPKGSISWGEDDIREFTPITPISSGPSLPRPSAATGSLTPLPLSPLPPPAPVMPDENVVGHPYKKGPIRALGNARAVDYIVVEQMPLALKVLEELKKVKQGADLYIEAIDLMDAEAAVAQVPAGRGGHVFFTIPSADTAKDTRRLILWRRAVAISQKFRLPSVVDDGDVRSAPQLGGSGQVWSYNRTSRYPSLIDTVSSALYDV